MDESTRIIPRKLLTAVAAACLAILAMQSPAARPAAREGAASHEPAPSAVVLIADGDRDDSAGADFRADPIESDPDAGPFAAGPESIELPAGCPRIGSLTGDAGAFGAGRCLVACPARGPPAARA